MLSYIGFFVFCAKVNGFLLHFYIYIINFAVFSRTIKIYDNYENQSTNQGTHDIEGMGTERRKCEAYRHHPARHGARRHRGVGTDRQMGELSSHEPDRERRPRNHLHLDGRGTRPLCLQCEPWQRKRQGPLLRCPHRGTASRHRPQRPLLDAHRKWRKPLLQRQVQRQRPCHHRHERQFRLLRFKLWLYWLFLWG